MENLLGAKRTNVRRSAPREYASTRYPVLEVHVMTAVGDMEEGRGNDGGGGWRMVMTENGRGKCRQTAPVEESMALLLIILFVFLFSERFLIPQTAKPRRGGVLLFFSLHFALPFHWSVALSNLQK